MAEPGPGLGALGAELDVDVDDVGFLASCDDADLARLTAAVRAAKARQADELQQAFDRTLEHVPRLLRGRVRKLLTGRDG